MSAPVEHLLGYSYNRVTGLTVPQFKALRTELSYTVDTGFIAGHKGFQTRYLLSARGEYPSGLQHRVMAFLERNGVNYTCRHENAKSISQVSFKFDPGMTPRKDQMEAVETAVAASRGTVEMATGSGKSLTIGMLIAKMRVKTLVVVTNLVLKQQIQQSLLDWFGPTKNIVVENIDSKRLKDLKDFDMLILDESHHAAASTYRKLNKTAWTGIKHRFCFTATAFRSKSEEQMLMEGITGETIYNLSYKKAKDLGIVAPVEAYYYELPKQTVKGSTWQQVYKQLVIENEFRNSLILDILSQLNEVNKSALCLVKEIKHGEYLAYAGGYDFVKGDNNDNSMILSTFNAGGKSVLVATTGCVGEGVDTKACEYVILCGLGKSKNAFMQQVGRAIRKFPNKESAKIIIFKDKSHRWTTKHFNEQVKILREEYGCEPVKLMLA